jgi:hypothetical protein
VELVEGALDRVRVWLHQLRVSWDAANAGLDQVVELVLLEESADGSLGVVADD